MTDVSGYSDPANSGQQLNKRTELHPPTPGFLKRFYYTTSADVIVLTVLQMILVASLSKPIEVTAKGTPRRQAVLEIYAQEIARIYSAVEDSFQKNLAAPIDFDIFSSLEFVRKVVGEVMPELPADDADIFQHGCDR
jgi:hypothetical protein